MFENISDLSHYFSSSARNTTEQNNWESPIQDLYSVTEELKCVYGYTVHMSKCLVKESINTYPNPRMIFSSSCDCVFFHKSIRDFCVLRVTRNAVHLMMVCCHDTLLRITNRHVFCLLLIDFKEWNDFSLQIFYMPCAMSYMRLSN